MNPETFKPFEVSQELKNKWNAFSTSERKALFEKAYRKTIAEPISGEAIIDIIAEKHADAPLETCYFIEHPDFQKELCAAVEEAK